MKKIIAIAFLVFSAVAHAAPPIIVRRTNWQVSRHSKQRILTIKIRPVTFMGSMGLSILKTLSIIHTGSTDRNTATTVLITHTLRIRQR